MSAPWASEWIRLLAALMSFEICSGLLYAKAKLHTTPALIEAATNSGVLIPPAMGAWMIGDLSLLKSNIFVVF